MEKNLRFYFGQFYKLSRDIIAYSHSHLFTHSFIYTLLVIFALYIFYLQCIAVYYNVYVGLMDDWIERSFEYTVRFIALRYIRSPNWNRSICLIFCFLFKRSLRMSFFSQRVLLEEILFPSFYNYEKIC